MSSATSDSSVILGRRILKPIQLGDTLPDIILKNELEEDVHIQNIADEYPVIIFGIFFYNFYNN